MTSYTKRCTKMRRVCWCKFGRNLTKSFCVICILVSLSLVPRQGLSLDFACLSIYSFAKSPELFVCLSIHENAETFPRFFQVSQCTHMKEIRSRVSSRIREKRWLPSVPRTIRTHTTVTVLFNIDTHNRNEVACIQESIFTSISAHIYICWKWENPII